MENDHDNEEPSSPVDLGVIPLADERPQTKPFSALTEQERDTWTRVTFRAIGRDRPRTWAECSNRFERLTVKEAVDARFYGRLPDERQVRRVRACIGLLGAGGGGHVYVGERKGVIVYSDGNYEYERGARRKWLNQAAEPEISYDPPQLTFKGLTRDVDAALNQFCLRGSDRTETIEQNSLKHELRMTVGLKEPSSAKKPRTTKRKHRAIPKGPSAGGKLTISYLERVGAPSEVDSRLVLSVNLVGRALGELPALVGEVIQSEFGEDAVIVAPSSGDLVIDTERLSPVRYDAVIFERQYRAESKGYDTAYLAQFAALLRALTQQLDGVLVVAAHEAPGEENSRRLHELGEPEEYQLRERRRRRRRPEP